SKLLRSEKVVPLTLASECSKSLSRSLMSFPRTRQSCCLIPAGKTSIAPVLRPYLQNGGLIADLPQSFWLAVPTGWPQACRKKPNYEYRSAPQLGRTSWSESCCWSNFIARRRFWPATLTTGHEIFRPAALHPYLVAIGINTFARQ